MFQNKLLWISLGISEEFKKSNGIRLARVYVFSCSPVGLIILIIFFFFLSLLWELSVLSGWMIRKDPGRLGCEVELRGEEKCFLYLLSLLISLALYWCNRSYVIVYLLWKGIFGWCKLCILWLSVIQWHMGEKCLPSHCEKIWSLNS